MDIHVLKTFIAVCEYSGFSAAAKKIRLYAVNGLFSDSTTGKRTECQFV